jgi:type IV secretory pathway TraG/TraD family ATPase VirD4
MDTKIYYRQASDETAEHIERSLGRRSGYAHSQTLRDGEEASQSLGEQAVPLLTARDISELSQDEIIAFHANRKPFRAKRMDWRRFPLLTQRRTIAPPILSPLPALSAIRFPSVQEQHGRWLRFPIDPDAMN